jgi:alkylresorcinol/alkylpyrone synthase
VTLIGVSRGIDLMAHAVEKTSSSSKPLAARLMSIGTAVPARRLLQADIQETMASIWGLRGADLDRWRRIIEGTGIETRHGTLLPEAVVGLTTGERMIAYEQFAPALAHEAARQAVAKSGLDADDITDLIVVSCTGFSAPGVDATLARSLGLRPTVRRMTIGFMGCFGAISGLRAGVGACCANGNAVVLVVCVELCSLHMRADHDAQSQVASALFADGAAAAVLVSADAEGGDAQGGGIGRVNTGASLLIEEGRDWMTWRITDTGFAMTLTREVPMALRRALAKFVRETSESSIRSFAIHPGGPGILDAADAALELNGGRGLEAARAVLRRIGNVSSATVLFVFEELLARRHPLPALLLAFGPGLTLESIVVTPAAVACPKED